MKERKKNIAQNNNHEPKFTKKCINNIKQDNHQEIANQPSSKIPHSKHPL